MKLIDEGSYAAARELLIQMGDYEDSAERVKELSYRIVAEAVRSAGEEYEGKYRVQKQIVSSTGADAVVSIYAVNDSSIALNYDYENTITGFYAKVSCTTAFAFDSDSMPVEYSRTMALKLFGLDENEKSVLLMPLGYPAENSVPAVQHKIRRKAEELVTYL